MLTTSRSSWSVCGLVCGVGHLINIGQYLPIVVRRSLLASASWKLKLAYSTMLSDDSSPCYECRLEHFLGSVDHGYSDSAHCQDQAANRQKVGIGSYVLHRSHYGAYACYNLVLVLILMELDIRSSLQQVQVFQASVFYGMDHLVSP